MRRLAAVGVLLGLVFATSRAEARGCTEVSDVVGEQNCSRYGQQWSIERTVPLTFRFGFRFSEFSTAGSQFVHANGKKNPPLYEFDGESIGVPKLRSYGVDGGLTYFVAGQLYVGGECGLGFAGTRTQTFDAGKYTLSQDGGIDVITWHFGMPIGYRVPIGRASIRGEMFVGGTMVEVQHQMRTAETAPVRNSAIASRWLVEPRVAADIWFTQHISFGAYGGVNLIDKGRVLGLSLTWHIRAFDGDMSFW